MWGRISVIARVMDADMMWLTTVTMTAELQALCVEIVRPIQNRLPDISLKSVAPIGQSMAITTRTRLLMKTEISWISIKFNQAAN